MIMILLNRLFYINFLYHVVRSTINGIPAMRRIRYINSYNAIPEIIRDQARRFTDCTRNCLKDTDPYQDPMFYRRRMSYYDPPDASFNDERFTPYERYKSIREFYGGNRQDPQSYRFRDKTWPRSMSKLAYKHLIDPLEEKYRIKRSLHSPFYHKHTQFGHPYEDDHYDRFGYRHIRRFRYPHNRTMRYIKRTDRPDYTAVHDSSDVGDRLDDIRSGCHNDVFMPNNREIESKDATKFRMR
ncbi:hypothetical protein EDEG_01867 [Edhazardia aedis USNM 41457]|uniref:Uncharacterized protein n=1 Tax=Edhazardia aedis (strain USNM 41457) TaxID=1003232 RepID=J9D7R4_EDHAE|nr:hypothetical protein EDEG_01867 [Edhazardia aedis USNM 41457]|eukprot:EJW03841.1 hypothetical protein EDEG_01867 [Edhazardia aedis USNM 41457]